MAKLLFTALAVVVFIGAEDVDAAMREIFCVQTFNAYGPVYAPLLPQRTEALGSYLRDNGSCEVVLMQEVWNPLHFTSLVQAIKRGQPEWAGYHFDSYRAEGEKAGLVFWTNGSPQMIQSNLYSINSGGSFDGVRRMFGVKKGWGRAEVHWPDKPLTSQVLFVTTHLHHSSELTRLAQLVDLTVDLELLEDFSRPVVITGDFNAVPFSLEWYFITDILKFEDAAYTLFGEEGAGCTYCRNNPISLTFGSYIWDYQFFRGGTQLDLDLLSVNRAFEQWDSLPLSDHYGLKAEFAVIEAPRDWVAENRDRKAHALATLERIETKLFGSGNPIFGETIRKLGQIRARLERF